MKDQNNLLKKCLNNDIPAIVFQGSDSCAVEILQAAEAIYRKHGCSPEFMKDFHENVVENFKAYQQEKTSEIKLPDLTESEKEIFRFFEEKEAATLPEQIKDFRTHLSNSGFTQTYEEIVSPGKYKILNEKEFGGIIGKNGDYEFCINYNKDTKQLNYYIFSNDIQYPERIGDYNSFKTCYTDIMLHHPLQEENNLFLKNIIKEYNQLGHINIASIIKSHGPYIENISDINNAKYTITNIEIQDTLSKTIIGDMTISTEKKIPQLHMGNIRIKDKTTGITGPLELNTDIDLTRQPIKSIESMLRGGEVKMTTNSGLSEMVGLHKTPVGWGLQICKQSLNFTEASTEL